MFRLCCFYSALYLVSVGSVTKGVPLLLGTSTREANEGETVFTICLISIFYCFLLKIISHMHDSLFPLPNAFCFD